MTRGMAHEADADVQLIRQLMRLVIRREIVLYLLAEAGGFGAERKAQKALDAANS